MPGVRGAVSECRGFGVMALRAGSLFFPLVVLHLFVLKERCFHGVVFSREPVWNSGRKNVPSRTFDIEFPSANVVGGVFLGVFEFYPFRGRVDDGQDGFVFYGPIQAPGVVGCAGAFGGGDGFFGQRRRQSMIWAEMAKAFRGFLSLAQRFSSGL